MAKNLKTRKKAPTYLAPQQMLGDPDVSRALRRDLARQAALKTHTLPQEILHEQLNKHQG